MAVGGALSGSILYVASLNELFGAKLKPIAGYAINQARLAMERREVDGASSLVWSVMQAEYPDWIREKKAKFLVQVALERLAELPDVPLLSELGRTADDRKIMRALSSSAIIGRTFVAPPGLLPARLETLRRAFDAAMADPEAVARASTMKLDLRPLTGEKLASLVREYDSLSPDLVDEIGRLAGVMKAK